MTPVQGRSLRSTLSAGGELRLALRTQDVPEPTGTQIVVEVKATPINPSDIAVLLAAASPDGLTRTDDGALVAQLPAQVLPVFRDRLDKALPVGNEGAGTVVAAGPDAQGLLGRDVALFGGAMWADYRVADANAVVPLPDGLEPAQAASLFVNPLTALSMVETMRAEGHTGLIHTAAASNLGQMLVKICRADGVPLVNIVRRPEQRELLEGIGATHVVDSGDPEFRTRLVEAVRATGATLAFDAIGGGTLAGQILEAIEFAQPPQPSYTPYGSSVAKQVYIYGGLDLSPTTIRRTFGLTWGIGGYLLTVAMGRLGPEAVARMQARAVAEATTTFASHYAETIGLGQVLDPATLAGFAARATGSKVLIDPSQDR